MQRTVDADAKTAESPTETTLVCGSSCSFAAAVVLAADVTAADADAATISAETTPVCGSSCSFAAAVDADSDSPLSKNSPVHILHRGVFCIGFHICGRSVYFSSFKGLFCPSSHCLLRSSCTSSSVILRFSIQSSSISYTAFPSMINFRFMPRTLLLFFSLL